MNKQLLRLAIPNIISNLSVPLLGAVDTALMGHMESSAYIGAIALGGIIFSFIYSGFSFLRMGTTGLVAQSFGNKDDGGVIVSLGRAAVVALCGGILVLLLQSPIEWISFNILEGSQEVEALAKEYYNIRIWAAPATVGLYAMLGWFLGMQNAKYPMYITIFINVANVLFNLLFIFQFNMASDGVALGTVCAQYLGLTLAIVLFFKTYRHYLSYWSKERFHKLNELKKFFTVNRDIFLRTLCLIFAFSFFTAKSATLGDQILAANAILLQLFMILSFGIDGFAYAAESLVGKYYGAKDLLNLKLAIKKSFYWGMILGMIYALVYGLGGKSLLGLFTDKPEIVDLANSFLFWTVIGSVINVAPYIWDGVYIGTTASVPMRNVMFISTFLVFIPLFYLLHPFVGNHALWIALQGFMISRGFIQTILAKRYIYTFT